MRPAKTLSDRDSVTLSSCSIVMVSRSPEFIQASMPGEAVDSRLRSSKADSDDFLLETVVRGGAANDNQ